MRAAFDVSVSLFSIKSFPVGSKSNFLLIYKSPQYRATESKPCLFERLESLLTQFPAKFGKQILKSLATTLTSKIEDLLFSRQMILKLAFSTFRPKNYGFFHNFLRWSGFVQINIRKSFSFTNITLQIQLSSLHFFFTPSHWSMLSFSFRESSKNLRGLEKHDIG